MKKSILGLMIIGLFCYSCEKEDVDNISGGQLPGALLGNVFTLEFTTADYGPYKMGDEVAFEFSSSGTLVIKDAIGNTLELDDFVIEGSEFIWEDNDHSKRYAVSLTNGDAEINEINLLEQSDNSFLGQFASPE